MSAWIYINGYPGVGKATIAQHLAHFFGETAKVYDNRDFNSSSTIVAVARSYPYSREIVSALKGIRRYTLRKIVDEERTEPRISIFTDSSTYSNEDRTVAAWDYEAAARHCGLPFISVILTCDMEENVKRLTHPSRWFKTTKLMDPDVLRTMRENEEIYRFGHALEVVLNVTNMRPAVAAQKILQLMDEAGQPAVRRMRLGGIEFRGAWEVYTGPDEVDEVDDLDEE
jgi:deoxyadenosine/deoxycytidine kinase